MNRDTIQIGIGAFSLNVELALKLGYNDAEVGSMTSALIALSRGFGANLAQRLGMNRICDMCEQWTYSDKPCHLCEADRKALGKKPRRYKDGNGFG